MSEQPVKCKMEDKNCTEFTIKEKCNADCEFYNPVDDHITEKVEEQIKESKPVLQFSPLPKFDKNFEFVVLKNHVFQFQSISPKKIILKFKRKLNKAESMQDGCYIFKNPGDGVMLKQTQIFGLLAKKVRDAQKAREKSIREVKEGKTE